MVFDQLSINVMHRTCFGHMHDKESACSSEPESPIIVLLQIFGCLSTWTEKERKIYNCSAYIVLHCPCVLLF